MRVRRRMRVYNNTPAKAIEARVKTTPAMMYELSSIVGAGDSVGVGSGDLVGVGAGDSVGVGSGDSVGSGETVGVGVGVGG